MKLMKSLSCTSSASSTLMYQSRIAAIWLVCSTIWDIFTGEGIVASTDGRGERRRCYSAIGANEITPSLHEATDAGNAGAKKRTAKRSRRPLRRTRRVGERN